MKDEKDVTSQGATTSGQTDSKALEMIKSSGILNPSYTLDKIMDLSSRVAGLASADLASAKAVDTFIHSHFIYKHES